MSSKLDCCGAILTFFAMLGCGQSPQPPPGGRQEPEPIEVTGKLVDAFSRPVDGATVIISGQAPTVTDGRGSFQMGNVTAPYELSVIDRDSEIHPLVLVYAGLTRHDPTLTTLPKRLQSASIGGQISGPNLGQSGAAVAFSSWDAIAASALVRADGTFSFSGENSIAWPGPGSISGSLHALQWQTSDSGPLAFSYGRKDNVLLEPGASLIDQRVQLDSVAASDLHVIIATGTFTLKDLTISISFDTDSLLPILVDAPARYDSTYKVPNIPDATCLLVVRAQSAVGSVTSREWGECRGDWVFTMSALVPELVTPSDGDINFNNGSEVSWRGLKQLYEIDLVPENSQHPRFVLRTSEQTIKLPDLSSAGLSLPHSANYSWQVRSRDTWGMIDDFASELELLNALESITNKPI